jgi:hypothetical protein
MVWLISLPQFVHLGMAEQPLYDKEFKHYHKLIMLFLQALSARGKRRATGSACQIVCLRLKLQPAGC